MPTQNANSTPEDLTNVINMAQDNLRRKVTDWELKQAGIVPKKVRR